MTTLLWILSKRKLGTSLKSHVFLSASTSTVPCSQPTHRERINTENREIEIDKKTSKFQRPRDTPVYTCLQCSAHLPNISIYREVKHYKIEENLKSIMWTWIWTWAEFCELRKALSFVQQKGKTRSGSSKSAKIMWFLQAASSDYSVSNEGMKIRILSLEHCTALCVK